MANISLCIYPLVDTVYSPFVTVGNQSCGLACGDGERAYVFFTDSEVDSLKLTVFLISLGILCLTPLYFGIVIVEQYETKKRFINLPFTQQCPFFISIGYLLIGLTSMSPFVFRKEKIICNSHESTLVHNTSQNPWCTLTAFAVFIGIRLAVFYICALSVSLFITLYYPRYKQKKRWYHMAVWGCIVMFIIPAITVDAVSGDMYLGICTVSLTSRDNLMLLDIVPLATLISIFTVCLALSITKLYQQNRWLNEMDHVNKDLKSLQNRLVIYNMLQTAAVFVVVGDFYWFWLNLNQWEATAKLIVECQVGLTLAGETTDYESCVKQYAHCPGPRVEAYWMFQLCALMSVTSVIVFQCSRKVQKESAATLVKISTMIGFSSLANLAHEDSLSYGSNRSPNDEGKVTTSENTSATSRQASLDKMWSEFARKHKSVPQSPSEIRKEYFSLCIL